MLIGCLALAGCPPHGRGFFSKDLIIEQALEHSTLLYAVLIFTAFLTSYYTFRLYFQVFEGPLLQPTTPADQQSSTAGSLPQAEATASHEAVTHPPLHTSGVDRAAAAHDDHHNHEPWVMLGPLLLLAVGALFFGSILPFRARSFANFVGHSQSLKLSYQMSAMRFGTAGVTPDVFGQGVTPATELIPVGWIVGGGVSVLGILLAYLLHLRSRPTSEKIASRLGPLTRLLEGKYWIDELYESAFVDPLHRIAAAFFMIDRVVVDSIVWAVGFIPQLTGFGVKLTVQRGYLQGYATAMLFGVLAILLLIYF